ncbi:MAG: TatD family hydrolase [Bacteroidia bacterium]|nr:TatD family hydrolase [Bacteroidia bacterium]MCZ2247384.1 TatD family hydrolase [Bacteroidia bacterium]
MIPFVNIHTHNNRHKGENIEIVDLSKIDHNISTSEIPAFSAGLHPWYIDIDNYELQLKQVYEKAILPGCMAIGECGIDKQIDIGLETQKTIFLQQINYAIQLRKPVIVHCVRAYDVLISMAKKYTHKVAFIVHGYNKNIQVAHQLINSGLFLSFGEAICNIKHKKIIDVFKHIPTHKIFLETDDANITIEQVYNAAAVLHNCSLNEMKEIIYNNYKHIFIDE